MDPLDLSFPRDPAGISPEREEVRQMDALMSQSGLSLSDADASDLAQANRDALAQTDRVEFRAGFLTKLLTVFCDSPYLSQADARETLCALIRSFYELKNETSDRLADDTLLQWMKESFDGPCGGSVQDTEDAVLRRWAGRDEEADGAMEDTDEG